MMIFAHLLLNGGPVMFAIAICSLIAVYIFFMKWFQFHRAQVDVRELVAGLVNVLRRDGLIEAITLCDFTPGPVARLLYSAINAYQNDDDIKQAIEAQALTEVPRLEAHLRVLATISYITPLLGLLGTVIGMFEVFKTLEGETSMMLPELSRGLYVALTCTAAGLCVSIPCHIAYNYLLARVAHLCLDMEKASSEIIEFFQHHEKGEGVPDGAVPNAASGEADHVAG